jgi:hypothetical protein
VKAAAPPGPASKGDADKVSVNNQNEPKAEENPATPGEVQNVRTTLASGGKVKISWD